MDKEFWLEKWQKNEIGFHNSDAHPLLVTHFQKLGLAPGSRVFLPLCGKTLDIGWLLTQGFRVCGAELSEEAVIQLFAQLELEPEIEQLNTLRRYSSDGLDIFVGDVFHLTAEMLGAIDAIYDRAALVALPENMRARYAGHLTTIAKTAPQLLISFDYDQNLLPGPPFRVGPDEVATLYGTQYVLNLLDSVAVEGGLKGKCPAEEQVWLLQPAKSA
ncbi:thiopurine S-methyltransferase [uncultured Microbulbifer sp.]|uniref:thiopurine S-methyltransferase n=1 Tax=uncultured Microbulbifer sp. TaxID=348147 RepID=UPI0026094676|nr:thiopurine S-methyltransferase [uncultured Microbulbifer sp.]